MKITFLGTGTSTGVPVLGCACEVCTSDDPRDRRLRPSILIGINGRNAVIDLTPDFRYQMLRAGAKRVEAVIITHEHADHVHGIDDVRPLHFFQKMAIPLYTTAKVGALLERKFAYCFGPRPRLARVDVTPPEPFDLLGASVRPLVAHHARTKVLCLRFENWAYCSDVKSFPDETLAALTGLDLLILDALRHLPHPKHLSIGEALELVDVLRPRRTLFTHMTHDVLHARDSKLLPDGVEFAVDGMVVEI